MNDFQLMELANFLSSARRTAQELNKALAEHDLREDLWRILMCLSQADGMSMGQISEALVLPHATTTRLIDEMTDSAMVFRRPSPHDGRKAIVYISQRGAEKLRRVNGVLTTRMGPSLQGLASTRAMPPLAEAHGA
jgi:DNA-binding MarR family transcriptional regulator